MLRRRSFALFTLALAASACGGGGKGSNCPPFAQIVGGDFGQDADLVWWTLTVAELPATLTFNQADVPANILEYQWAVDLDSDRDGETDLRVAVSHFRESGAPEIVTDDPLSVASQDLWSVSGAASSISGRIGATVSGNTFRLEAVLTEDPGLAEITERAQSTWTTFHTFGPNLGDQCEDRLN